MPYEFRFPDVGEGITEGEIVKWLVKPGDKIKEDQTIAKIETDKAVVDVPSPKSGTVLEIRVAEGSTVKVGETMITIGDSGEQVKGIEKKRAIFLRMFWNEFGDLLKNPAKLEKRLIKRRSATLYFGNGKALYLPGIAIKKRKPVKNDVLKGVIASKGSAKGAARIILGQKDFHKFRKGDILISEATRPEFLPIMKKAAAIVTEEGGITSHAAIVSRELKVPCIVGVSHITSILKNGDKVEVDANTGTIKLLKK